MPMAATRTDSPVHVVLRRFDEVDLPALVALWNEAFCDRHNFWPLTAQTFRRRVLASPAFDPGGLILAWAQGEENPMLVGFVHAFKPAPRLGQYRNWPPQHQIALLYVKPGYRRQGVGSRLLQAAENWLYYCPVHIGGDGMACYGLLEGPMPPFFGSTDRLAIDAAGAVEEIELVRFLARRGYAVDDAGDVSMVLALDGHHLASANGVDPAGWGLQRRSIDNDHPFTGAEPPGREEVSLWGDNRGHPYGGIIYTDDGGGLRGHISWYPMATVDSDAARGAAGVAARHLALSRLWLAPALRGQGLGGHLLDLGLRAMAQGGPARIELHTHLLHNDHAVTLYESRGFQIDKAWVKLVKT